MSLMEHLEELRKRILRSLGFFAAGFAVAYGFHNTLVAIIQKPLVDVGLRMTMTHPTDALNLILKTSAVAGAILASPFILYQVWLFISPGMYANERKYVTPFMSATVGLFLAGTWFGYRWVLPGAIKILVMDFGKNFSHMITIDDYTGFFLAVILGLGICFELPILIFFLSKIGVVNSRWMLKNFKYAVLIVFIIAAFITPTPDPINQTILALPMVALYSLGILIAFFFGKERTERKEKRRVRKAGKAPAAAAS